MTRLVSLGDSFSCGQGVGLRVELSRTWGGLLAAALPDCAWTPLAAPGARTAAVREQQLPAALAVRPDVATVLTGLNDVIRSGFDARAVGADLGHVVGALRSSGAIVLLARLHDPTRVLRLAGPLRRAVHSRVDALNAAVDGTVATTGALVLDLRQITGLDASSSWAVDRLHPSPAGHRAMAVAAATALRSVGVAVHVDAVSPGPAPAPGAVETMGWLLRHGVPWGAAHARSVGLPLLAAVGRQH